MTRIIYSFLNVTVIVFFFRGAWYGDVVAESMVIQYVDAEEEHNVDQPAADRHAVGLDEERRARQIELRDVPGDSHEEEWHEG